VTAEQVVIGTGRRRSRREEILEIAVALFAERGYHGVSMDDVGAAAG
jgi:AcrR family transcriptional regulator